MYELAGWHAEVYATDLPAHEARLRTLPRLVIDHMGMNPEGLAAAVRLGASSRATPRFEGDLRAVPSNKLLFGTDLPGTRARRRFDPADVERVAAIAPAALADNARAWYRPGHELRHPPRRQVRQAEPGRHPCEIAAHEPWFNQTLTTVNDSVVRLGIIEGDFHWHKHDADDEFFLVLEGRLLIDLEDRETVTLEPHQGYTVPRGVMHRTRAPEGAAILMVEPAGSSRPGISPPRSSRR